MSGFWESEIGEVTGTAEDAFAKSFKQIPDGTMALARIETFKKALDQQKNPHFNIEWVLTDGDFKGQKVNQKLKVWGDPRDKDPARTKHRALNMLKLIYQLYKVQPKNGAEPTDQDLAVFVGKEAGIKIRETEPNEEGKQYNWVAEIHDAKGFVCETGIKLEVTHTFNDRMDSALDRNRARQQGAQVEDDVPF